MDSFNVYKKKYLKEQIDMLSKVLYVLKFETKEIKKIIDKDAITELIEIIEVYIRAKNIISRKFYTTEYAKFDPNIEMNLDNIIKYTLGIIPNYYLKDKGIPIYSMYSEERLLNERYYSSNKNLALLGSVGSGKTTAIKNEIKLLLENTFDDIIVMDSDGLYDEFNKNKNLNHVTLDKNHENTSHDKDKNKHIFNEEKAFNSRFNIFDTLKIDLCKNDLYMSYLNRILKIAEKKLNDDKKIWLYIDGLKYTDDFIDKLIKISFTKKELIVTISTNDVSTFLENDYISKYFALTGLIRIFKVNHSDRRKIADKYNININLLNFDNIETSVILNNNFNQSKKPVIVKSFLL